MKSQTLYDIYACATERYSERTAFSLWQGADVTYAQVRQRVEQVQSMLAGAGLQPGDRVALLSSNTPNWCVCYLAATISSYVVVPIMSDLTTEGIDRVVEHSEAKALCISDRLFSKVAKPTLDGFNIVIRTKNLKVLSQRTKQEGTTALPQGDTPAALLYTSGTTSQPKGVLLSHAGLVAQIPMIDGLLGIHPDDVLLSVLPLAHTYECTLGFLAPFSCGARVVHLDKMPTLSILLPALKQIRPTVIFTVPLFIEKMYRREVRAKIMSNFILRTLCRWRGTRRMLFRYAVLRLNRLFGGRLRIFGIGGAKLDTKVERFLIEGGFHYNSLYGLTETAPLLAGVSGTPRPGSTGPLLPGVEGRIDNKNSHTGLGELLVRTPSLMMQYYKNEEATAEVITEDGWFRTGDLACFDADGWLYIKGRAKNIIIGANGENIYPEDIESVLNDHLFVSEAVVVERKRSPMAFVHLDIETIRARYGDMVDEWDGNPAAWHTFRRRLLEDIMSQANARLNAASHITDIIEEGELLKTPSNKICRHIYTARAQSL